MSEYPKMSPEEDKKWKLNVLEGILVNATEVEDWLRAYIRAYPKNKNIQKFKEFLEDLEYYQNKLIIKEIDKI